MKRISFLATMVVIFVATPFSVHAGSVCEKMIPPFGAVGVVEKYDESDFDQFASSYACTYEMKTHDEALSLGFASAYGKKLMKGLSFAKDERDDWRREHCEQSQSRTIDKKRMHFFSLVHMPELAAQIVHCHFVDSKKTGLVSVLSPLSSCDFQLYLRYMPGKNDPKTIRLKTTPELTGANCGKSFLKGSKIPFAGDKIDQDGVAFSCKRLGSQAVHFSLNTEAGGVAETLPALEKPPAPPAPVNELRWQNVDEGGAAYVKQCAINSSTHTGCLTSVKLHLVNSSVCTVYSGTCAVPEGARITTVVYSGCSGGGCGWSYHRENSGGYSADYTTSGNTMTWYRRWTGSRDFTETYTIKYEQLRAVCTANCGDYQGRLLAWQKMPLPSCPNP